MTATQTKDILTLIETDHRKVEELKNTNGTQKYDQYFIQIAQELTLHSKAEKLVFYLAMREYEETNQYVEEAESEHTEVKILLEEMTKLDFTNTEFKNKMQELIKAVSHHVKEEENEIFQAVRQCINAQQLQKLGEEFQATKAKLEPEAKVTAR